MQAGYAQSGNGLHLFVWPSAACGAREAIPLLSQFELNNFMVERIEGRSPLSRRPIRQSILIDERGGRGSARVRGGPKQGGPKQGGTGLGLS